MVKYRSLRAVQLIEPTEFAGPEVSLLFYASLLRICLILPVLKTLRITALASLVHDRQRPVHTAVVFEFSEIEALSVTIIHTLDYCLSGLRRSDHNNYWSHFLSHSILKKLTRNTLTVRIYIRAVAAQQLKAIDLALRARKLLKGLPLWYVNCKRSSVNQSAAKDIGGGVSIEITMWDNGEQRNP